MIYTNEISDKYFISENGDEYTLEYIHGGDVIIDNIVYSYDNYIEMMEAQANDLKNISRFNLSILDYAKKYHGTINTIDYEAINNEIQEKKIVDHSAHFNLLLRCNNCGKYSPASAPKSGYKAFPSSSTKMPKASPFLVDFTSSALTAIATYFFFGKINEASLFVDFILSHSSGVVVGEWISGGYYLRQAQHTVCPIAVAEERKSYYYDSDLKKDITYNAPSYNYFYSENPY